MQSIKEIKDCFSAASKYLDTCLNFSKHFKEILQNPKAGLFRGNMYLDFVIVVFVTLICFFLANKNEHVLLVCGGSAVLIFSCLYFSYKLELAKLRIGNDNSKRVDKIRALEIEAERLKRQLEQ